MSVWHLSESECHHMLQVDEAHKHRTQFELDIDEGINFTTSVAVEGTALFQYKVYHHQMPCDVAKPCQLVLLDNDKGRFPGTPKAISFAPHVTALDHGWWPLSESSEASHA